MCLLLALKRRRPITWRSERRRESQLCCYSTWIYAEGAAAGPVSSQLEVKLLPSALQNRQCRLWESKRDDPALWQVSLSLPREVCSASPTKVRAPEQVSCLLALELYSISSELNFSCISNCSLHLSSLEVNSLPRKGRNTTLQRFAIFKFKLPSSLVLSQGLRRVCEQVPERSQRDASP